MRDVAPYLSDARRVELALPAALLYRVFSTCVARVSDNPPPTDEELANDKLVLHWLATAAAEPLVGVDPRKAASLARRISRLQAEILMPYEDRPIMTVFLVVLRWLQGMLEHGVLVLVEGSAFDRAATEILANLERFPDLMEGVDKSASKNARRIAEYLQDRGFYRSAA